MKGVNPALITVILFLSLFAAASSLSPSTFPGATIAGALVPSSAPSLTSTNTASTNSTTGTPTSTATAQFPSLSGYPSCVTSCLDQASAAANCTSVVDVNCFCVSNVFTGDIVDCISAGCPQELSTAESLAQKFCNLASTSMSLSFPSPPSPPSTTVALPTNSTSSTAANAPTASSKNLALSLSSSFPGTSWLLRFMLVALWAMSII